MVLNKEARQNQIYISQRLHCVISQGPIRREKLHSNLKRESLISGIINYLTGGQSNEGLGCKTGREF